MTKNSVEKKLKKNEELVRSYKAVFGSDDGQKVLLDLMSRFNMLNSTYQGNKDDMIYAEGGRAVCLHILSILETDIEKLKAAIERAHDQGVRNVI